MVSFMEIGVDLKAQLTLPVQVVAKMAVGSTASQPKMGSHSYIIWYLMLH